MNHEELRGEHARRTRSRRRRSAAIAVACAGAMLVLTAGVFSVASTSRQVARQSSRVHVLDEILTSATIVRAQLGFGLVLADLDNFSDVDASAAVTTSEADILTSLASLEQSRDLLAVTSDGLSAPTTNALDAFERAVSGRLPLATAGDAVEATAELERAYLDANAVLIVERDEAIQAVEDADRSLSRLSTLVSFLTAFVIPTLAIIIYRLLSAPQRELLEAQARASRDTALNEIRRGLLLSRLEQLHEQAGQPADPESGRPSIASRIDDVRRVALTLEGSQRCEFTLVDVGETLMGAAAKVGETLNVHWPEDQNVQVWSDPEVLGLLFASLIADSGQRRAMTLHVDAELSETTAAIRFRHDGAPRSPAEAKVITTQATIADRLTLLDGPDVDLVAALHLAEDIQGSLDLAAAANTEQVLTLRLPGGWTHPDRRPQLAGAESA